MLRRLHFYFIIDASSGGYFYFCNIIATSFGGNSTSMSLVQPPLADILLLCHSHNLLWRPSYFLQRCFNLHLLHPLTASLIILTTSSGDQFYFYIIITTSSGGYFYYCIILTTYSGGHPTFCNDASTCIYFTH